jgi:hypothetical protein
MDQLVKSEKQSIDAILDTSLTSQAYKCNLYSPHRGAVPYVQLVMAPRPRSNDVFAVVAERRRAPLAVMHRVAERITRHQHLRVAAQVEFEKQRLETGISLNVHIV